MRNPFRSFYARLSGIFLLLVLALGAAVIAIAFTAAGRLSDDVERVLNRDYAGNIAGELSPLLAGGIDEKQLEGAIHYMMALNPRVEIYLLDAAGNVLSYFAAPSDSEVKSPVNTAPLEDYIKSGGKAPLLGQDPRNENRMKPFSAARLAIGGMQGYVYVILGGRSYDESLESARYGYYVRAGLAALLPAVLATLLAGFSLFFLLTRRLRALGAAVKAYRAGELDLRVQGGGSDEIGELGRSFNEMAAALEAGVEKLRLSERLRTELIANVSHDLRSPLASVRGYLETVILKNGQITAEQRREFLEICMKNVGSLGRLVEELFELVRLETRQVQPRRECLQIAELAQDVALKLRPQAEAAAVDLKALPSDGIPLVQADVGMIERVMTNLIENALRFTPAGGSVRVEVSMMQREVAVRVTDTGRGIAAEDLPHVFDRFYRSDKSRDRTAGGAGLGLAIAKGIVELHGGRISAVSAPGRGSTFTFLLPACP